MYVGPLGVFDAIFMLVNEGLSQFDYHDRRTNMMGRRHGFGGQEIGQAGADLPLTAPESTAAAPMQTRQRQSKSKVGSVNLGIACRLQVLCRCLTRLF